MPNIRVDVRRTDCEESDVSASHRHLNERAEERKEEDKQSARAKMEMAAAVESPEQGTGAGAPSQNGNTAHSNGTSAPGEEQEGEPKVLERPEAPGLLTQTSIIQAERTDNETHDAREGQGGDRGGWWCCWRRQERA